MEIKKTRDLSSPIYQHALEIRQIVFVIEQQVPLELEIDANEGACVHFVLYNSEKIPVSTLRILSDKDSKKVLIQRVATLRAYRGCGYAAKLLTSALDFLKTQNITQVELHAQLQAIAFYEKLGFQAFGSEFLDADIPHMSMIKII